MTDQQIIALEKVVSKNFKDKLADSWNKYQAFCKREGEPIKPILRDPSLYTVKHIKIEHVVKLLTKELNEVKETVANKEKADPVRRAAKRRRLEKENSEKRGITCDKCAGHRILHISSKASDRNYLIFPNGFEYDDYLPTLPGIGSGDYVRMNVCVDCGHIIGFDSQAVLNELERVEADPDAVGE